MSNDDLKLLLRVPEAADRLGVGRSTLYLMLARKELPVVRIGAAVRIPRTALEEWLQKRLAEAD
jgi:excisionase family DNA binding protein